VKPRSQVRRRGQPLVALGLIMVSWVGARAAMWDSTLAPATGPDHRPNATAAAAQGQRPVAGPNASRLVPHRQNLVPTAQPTLAPPIAPLVMPSTTPPLLETGAESSGTVTAEKASRISVSTAVGHQELWLAGMSMLPSEPALAMAPQRPSLPFAAAAGKTSSPRWSADGWLLLRSGGNAFNAPGAGLPGAIIPTGFYGGSQGGLILRYFLAPGSARSPALYLRASSGIERPRGEELAVGISIRPVAGMPVRLLAEGRVTRTTSGTIVRPAAALVSELPPVRLPFGARAEAYVQAGYVGGRSATAFVDGQARVEHPLFHAGNFELRAGGGVWGGAQRGANRVDIGPTATINFRLGPTNTRLSADYRWRVSGNAAPGSGPVVTLSAGF